MFFFQIKKKLNNMKKLILIIITLALFGCENPIAKLEPSKQETITTQQILNKASEDSTLYKVVTIENSLYAVNTQTNLVELRVKDFTDAVMILFIIILALIAFILIVMAP